MTALLAIIIICVMVMMITVLIIVPVMFGLIQYQWLDNPMSIIMRVISILFLLSCLILDSLIPLLILGIVLVIYYIIDRKTKKE